MDPWKALERIDPWGEWRNPHEHPEVLEALTAGDWAYEQSVGYIRALRPREDPHEATRWWASPETRAHLLNAILRRGSRPLVWVEKELDLPRWKLHYYLDQFGLKLRLRPRRVAHVILPDGDTDEGRILEILSQAPVEGIVEARQVWWRARWSPSSWAFRVLEVVPPPPKRWQAVLAREPALRNVDPETVLHYLGPEGLARLIRGDTRDREEKSA